MDVADSEEQLLALSIPLHLSEGHAIVVPSAVAHAYRQTILSVAEPTDAAVVSRRRILGSNSRVNVMSSNGLGKFTSDKGRLVAQGDSPPKDPEAVPRGTTPALMHVAK
ncbi:hypothetical protein A3A71_00720 [Candidatus Berkelbacteria bacterium RIFCSPLOWO2_01_FULL_50_28]|uniref:Uncharacterized protein n=1 Tax=Candidatus Berkelbacteria bacterium RIFCSPLOWO2_01_FULL_50_28 TaxID=1797471 RepID=A0A1F5EB11_9BACT|nr:MAG: hypothetical protein A3F39_04005 [Candidatus Berkelbacteria bacterium RIFCSPHIGHO2_12_FULL_50_11]OGD64565.1 MAG: hypothetical protein A3A71_00720 [Candidatus Berkelbacteria bacterium RIFCSPLOWO2_01_FULL_50_28]